MPGRVSAAGATRVRLPGVRPPSAGPGAAATVPFAPVQLYILLAITIATLGWLWPRESEAPVSPMRLTACWALVLLEALHLVLSNVTEIPRYVDVPAHVFLLLGYVTVTSEMLYAAQRRRVGVTDSAPSASG